MNDDRKIEVYREADTSKLFSYIDNVSLSREMKAKLIKNAEDAKNTNPGGMKIVRGSFLGFGVSAAVMCLILGGAFLYMKANPADIPILSGRVFEPRSESSISAVSEEMVDVEDTLPKNSVANVENDHDTESMDGFANNRGIAGVPANTVTATTNGDEGQADAAVHTPPPTETTRTVTSATTNTSGGTTESSAMPPPPPSPPLQPTPPT
ncbi:MAG: hypothetical protein FWH07_06815, partial [Oscillospiraceae bacterium]|nr:hypothetical protein [Oscillospiraceae bacterium]